jgi:hypothetical protein
MLINFVIMIMVNIVVHYYYHVDVETNLANYGGYN